jgi:spheroidene monooxygenase
MPTPASEPPLQGLLVVALADYQPRHKAWGWLRLAQGPRELAQVPGLLFCKVMGSGQGGGFSLRPSATHQGLMAAFKDADTAQSFLEGELLRTMRERSRQFWAGLMSIQSARGAWDGQTWAPTPEDCMGPHTGALASSQRQPALAVLTRASIRPAQALHFWRHAPASQSALQSAPGCLLAIGLGEAPLLRQCTFSLWRNTASMQAYAQSGAHGRAAQAAWQKDFFSESLFMRMHLLSHEGHWQRLGAV